MNCLNCRTQPARTKYCSRACQLAHRARKGREAPPTETHIIIPDTQTKPGIPADHLHWIGQYIRAWADQHPGQDLKIIHLGDHWDMPSLSSYDQGKRSMEGRRINEDIEAGNYGIGILDRYLDETAADRHFLYGNHEDRISRATEHDAQLAGFLTHDLLDLSGWRTHPYQSTLLLGGVTYSHFFYNPLSGRPYAGTSIELRLKTIGFSFTMGHQQGLWWARRELNNGRTQCGLVAGSCYLHAEIYKGPQANDHWRGIVVCHNVEDGVYDPMFVSLDYLCRKYEGSRLSDFSPKEWIK